MEHKAYWALKNANFDPKEIKKNRLTQLHKLAELRDEAYGHSKAYKERTKRWHDARIREKEFEVGQKVLIYNSRLRLLSGKLKSRWYGPYTVTEVFPDGTIEVIDDQDQRFILND